MYSFVASPPTVASPPMVPELWSDITSFSRSSYMKVQKLCLSFYTTQIQWKSIQNGKNTQN